MSEEKARKRHRGKWVKESTLCSAFAISSLITMCICVYFFTTWHISIDKLIAFLFVLVWTALLAVWVNMALIWTELERGDR